MKQQAWEELKQERDDLKQRIERIKVEAEAGSDLLVSNQYMFMSGYMFNLELRIAVETENRRKFATGEK